LVGRVARRAIVKKKNQPTQIIVGLQQIETL
jgi:hypothetical protein